MSIAESGIDQFLQIWASEFSRSLASSLNEMPVVTCSRARHLALIDLTGVLWWRAELQADRRFPIWVGTRELTWSTVGKLNWIRLLERVQAATVLAINPDLIQPLHCGEATVVHIAPDVDSLCYALVGIRLSHSEVPSLLVAIDPLAREELKFHSPAEAMTPMLQHLLDLELPLSVALGRATLPIGEVLKFTPGSVIHLNGHTGEAVEIVVHGTVVAKGQVVASKGTYGVRIKEIISPVDRLNLYDGQ